MYWKIRDLRYKTPLNFTVEFNHFHISIQECGSLLSEVITNQILFLLMLLNLWLEYARPYHLKFVQHRLARVCRAIALSAGYLCLIARAFA